MAPTNTKQKWNRNTKLLICLLVGFFVFTSIVVPGAFLTGVWLSERQKKAERPPQVKVPNVIGQDFRAAEVMLKEKGLGMRVLARRSDQNQPMDIVLDQTPFGGENVDVGHTIEVTLGNFKTDATVPPHR